MCDRANLLPHRLGSKCLPSQFGGSSIYQSASPDSFELNLHFPSFRASCTNSTAVHQCHNMCCLQFSNLSWEALELSNYNKQLKFFFFSTTTRVSGKSDRMHVTYMQILFELEMEICQHCLVKNWISVTAWDITAKTVCMQLDWASRGTEDNSTEWKDTEIHSELSWRKCAFPSQLLCTCLWKNLCHFSLVPWKSYGLCSKQRMQSSPQVSIKVNGIRRQMFYPALRICSHITCSYSTVQWIHFVKWTKSTMHSVWLILLLHLVTTL